MGAGLELRLRLDACPTHGQSEVESATLLK